jgi:hypothetical protein
MRRERGLLRLGEYLVRHASRHLPAEIRDERYREWAAELPAILNDPDIKHTARRAARMLRYAADTIRGSALTSGRSRRILARMPVVSRLWLMALLVGVIGALWNILQAPGD